MMNSEPKDNEEYRRLVKETAWMIKEQKRQELETQIETAMNRLKEEEFVLPALPWRSSRVVREDQQAIAWLIYSESKNL